MEKLSRHILNLIFSHFNKGYRPFLRLVCRKFAQVIKNRRCLYSNIISDINQPKLSLVKELEKYFPVPSQSIFRRIGYKLWYDDKILVLDYLKNQLEFIKINWEKIPDVETLEFLYQHKINIPQKVRLSYYNKEVLRFHQYQNYKIQFSPFYIVPKVDLDQLNLPVCEINLQQAYHDIIPKLGYTKNLLIKAVLGKAKTVIEYLLDQNVDLSINFLHYWLCRSDLSFMSYLLTLRQNHSGHPFCKGRLSLDFYKLYTEKYGFTTMKYWSWIIASNRRDLAEWLEWHLKLPRRKVFQRVNELCRDSFIEGPQIEILEWCRHRNILTTRFSFPMMEKMNMRTVFWLLDNHLTRSPRFYIACLKRGEYFELDSLSQYSLQQAKNGTLNRIKKFVDHRKSSQINFWFNKFCIINQEKKNELDVSHSI